MTLSEFKAWFSGYTEEMDGPPNSKQWKKIKARVKEIDGEVITEHHFIDRWYPRYRDFTPYWSTSDKILCGSAGTSNINAVAQNSVEPFDSQGAMFALGAAEYSENDYR